VTNNPIMTSATTTNVPATAPVLAKKLADPEELPLRTRGEVVEEEESERGPEMMAVITEVTITTCPPEVVV
jgi:hypothetical protein